MVTVNRNYHTTIAKMKVFETLILSLLFTLLFSTSYAQQSDSCKVKLHEISGAFKGECKRGFAHGSGTAQGTDTYIGNFKNGLPEGEGKYIYANGNTYTGTFHNGLKDGKGIFRFLEDGTLFVQEGYWLNGEYEGKTDPKNSYKITNAIGIDNVTIKKGKGVQDEIKIQIYSVFTRFVPDGLLIIRSTGEMQQEARDFIIYKYTCPFTCSISYRINSCFGLMRKCYLDFEISEPGSYDVIINNQ